MSKIVTFIKAMYTELYYLVKKQNIEKKSILEYNSKQLEHCSRKLNELLWAEIFISTTHGSTWFKDKRLAPGRWALGYPALYILFKILDIIQPMEILELGLGESTRMITQYTISHENTIHSIVEHDTDWVTFFQKNFKLCERSKILIDAPFGADMLTYSRIDVLRMLPGVLKESYVILLDDFNRPGEQGTAKAMLEILTNHSRKKDLPPPVSGIYSGEKDTFIICSYNNRFLTSL